MLSGSNSGVSEGVTRQDRIDHAIGRLKSLHDGEAGFSEVVALGPDAVPALRRLLLERERSGLHQARCRAAEALAALKAFDVLAEFLRLARSITDPVERLGEEVVQSTAARSIARLREEWVYHLLADLAARRSLGGILIGLGTFHRKESIPTFINALIEDDLRLTAEAMLRTFGAAARPALTAAALDRGPDDRSESETHLRKRRSAFALLLDIGIPRRSWSDIRPLMDDDDLQIALLACQACVDFGTTKDRALIPSRLGDLKRKADWLAEERIEGLLEISGRRASAVAKPR